MTGTSRSSEGLDTRRRKLLFRCWHRGMREMGLIMGRFADAAVGQLPPDEPAEFDHLMEVPARELLAWSTGDADVPPEYDTGLFRRLRDFTRRGEGARWALLAIPPNCSSLVARSRWQASRTAP